jgi:glycine cleavage system aminomethyltransferase T
VGQEVIIRVLHRGHGRVARKLVGLTFDGVSAAPSSGMAVEAEGREVGHITSSALSAALKRPIAFAYVHRDFVDPGTKVSAGGYPGVVTALPFVSPSA